MTKNVKTIKVLSMSYRFTEEEIKTISGVLEAESKKFDGGWSWMLHNTESGQSLVISIYNDVNLGNNASGALISVQTQHGYFELHDVSAFLVFEPDEVIFVQADDKRVSSLIIGKLCTCSMYTNINRDILSADFASLDPAVLLSAMQLSLTEVVLP